jgi:hypothetical protein
MLSPVRGSTCLVFFCYLHEGNVQNGLSRRRGVPGENRLTARRAEEGAQQTQPSH